MPATADTRATPQVSWEAAGDAASVVHDSEAAVRLDHVTKAFGGRKVLDDV